MTDPGLELLRRWQDAKDVDALDALLRLEVSALADRLRRRGGTMIRASQSASDLAQEAVTRLLERETPPLFEDPRQLRAYLWKSAWRLLLNRVGSASRRVTRLSSAPGGSESRSLGDVLTTSGVLSGVLAREQSLAVDVALQLLPDEDIGILELVYFEDVPIADAAARLGITRAAADMRLTRARRRLAGKLLEWNDLMGE